MDGKSADWTVPFHLIGSNLGNFAMLYSVLVAIAPNETISMPLSEDEVRIKLKDAFDAVLDVAAEMVAPYLGDSDK